MSKQKTFNMTLYWLMNHIIHYNDHKLKIYEAREPYEKDFFICEWDDTYYQEHKQDLYPRIVSFILVVKNEIKVYLKEQS